MMHFSRLMAMADCTYLYRSPVLLSTPFPRECLVTVVLKHLLTYTYSYLSYVGGTVRPWHLYRAYTCVESTRMQRGLFARPAAGFKTMMGCPS